MMGGIRRFLFWEFPRASWQYDVMVGLILVFIFVTPLFLNFRDQPKPASINMLPEQGGYLIETRLLSGVAEADLAAKATQLVNSRYKTHATVVRVEPIKDPEDEIIGYTAFTRP